jgi:tRNA 2-selenouridine synthase
MLKNIDYKDMDNESILIDLRSPKEYSEATIPGAINLPLFTDEERQQIGYVYVNESVEKAKKMGVEAVSKKLPQLYEDVLQLDKRKEKLVFFCARGGMRSSSFCALLNSIGVDAVKLNSGYKGYRAFINAELPKVNEGVKYIVLHGKTGVGKTEILSELKKRGYDVLDLEEAANHRGSILGSVGIGEGSSQKQFEALVYEMLYSRKNDYVFVEAESKRIGNVIIPSYIHKSMVDGKHILIDADMDFRAKLIVDEYLKYPESVGDILSALEGLSKYIGEKNARAYKELVQQGDYKTVAEELMGKHYDPMYMNEIEKYEYDLSININGIKEGCTLIEKWLQCNIDFQVAFSD